MVPCKECLVKAICVQKVGRGNLTVTSLECPILNKWLTTYNGSGSYGVNLMNAYKELKSSKRSKELAKFIEKCQSQQK